ncbi:hypothetical protein BC835DRAFT_1310171 [Cytidiella melzeri]|nr:hypothetical protein BC835DRAFT_1310171 [Cytidiella melzeri]
MVENHQVGSKPARSRRRKGTEDPEYDEVQPALLFNHFLLSSLDFNFTHSSPSQSALLNMARTKQTAPKSTGGNAPRRALRARVAEPTPPEGAAWGSNDDEKENKDSVPVTYLGLYNEDGHAMFPDGLEITPQTFVPQEPVFASPVCASTVSKRRAWPSPVGISLFLHTLDLTGPRTLDDEVADMAELGRQAAGYDEIIIFLCTHSDETRGDLFWEPNGAISVKDFFSSIFGDLLLPLAKKNIIMFFLACGAVIHYKESSSDLQAVVSTYNIKHCFAFTAKTLLAFEIFSFVQGYVNSIMLQGLEPAKHLEHLLDQCFSVGLHTNIVWLKPNATPVCYTWTERVVRPWGHSLPYQCSVCKSLWSWRRCKGKRADGSIAFFCRGTLYSGMPCDAKVFISNDMNLVPVTQGHKGTWMKGTL